MDASDPLPAPPPEPAAIPVAPASQALRAVAERIVRCHRCPRLVAYRARVSRDKKKGFEGWDYWGRPLPGFGDPVARLVIIGLAPASHGGNRTGRMFTGDASARFLMSALHEAGFASLPTSERRDDGLRLADAYLTAAVRCCPPMDRPSAREIANCSEHLAAELRALPNARVVLALGRIAFFAYLDFMAKEHGVKAPLPFSHGRFYALGRGLPALCASYHPSPRNTQTGRLRRQDFMALLLKVRQALGDPGPALY